MQDLNSALNRVEQLARTSKLGRLVANPFRYLRAIGHHRLAYPVTRRGLLIETPAFFGQNMTVLLPAGTDIYLTGGKTHDSEIRLARLLIQNLRPGDCFVDVGAHFGYFSLLAAQIVGVQGKVFSFEASKGTFEILTKNVQKTPVIQPYNLAVSDQAGVLQFYEFPILYSEYNSMDISQFEQEKWFEKFKPVRYDINSVALDAFFETEKIQPKIIKIDVEGAEFMVFNGMKRWLQEQKGGLIVMEYLSADRHNDAHQKTVQFMRDLGYQTCVADQNGQLFAVQDMDEYLKTQGEDSENVVFTRI